MKILVAVVRPGLSCTSVELIRKIRLTYRAELESGSMLSIGGCWQTFPRGGTSIFMDESGCSP